MIRVRLAAGITAACLAAMGPIPGPAAAADLPSECVQSGATVTCTYTTGDNLFTVPDSVVTIHVIAVGGRGGALGSVPGGRGAVVSADIVVVPSQQLHAVVGGNGGAPGGGDGGANGGGWAGIGLKTGTGGGGASDIRTGSTLETRILVAGGGGGAGYLDPNSDPNFRVVPFGGAAGQPGTPGSPTVIDGAGGAAGCASVADTECGQGGPGATTSLIRPGQAGFSGQLGVGGTAGQLNAGISIYPQYGGGGGGGGLYGGGGGGSGSPEDPRGANGGGGGGGSSLVPAGGSFAIDTSLVPNIEISYTTDAGTGSAPAASLDVTSIDFGTALVGTTSASETVTLTNTGTAMLVVSVPSLTGSNVTDFRIISNGCSNASLDPGEQCLTQAAFSPTAQGHRSAILRFTDNAGDSPHDVDLTGFGSTPGADVGVILSAAPGSAKIGHLIRYTITVSNIGPSVASGVTVSDLLPTQVTFISATASQGSCAAPISGAVGCSILSIANGATVTIQIVVQVTARKTSMTDSVSVSASTSDPNLVNTSASVLTRVR